MNKHNLIFFILLSWMISFQESLASHIAGMDISYECISQGVSSDQYKITVKFYRDCSSSTSAPAFGWQSPLNLEYSSASCNRNENRIFSFVSSTNITPTCSFITDPCNEPGIVGIEEYIYETSVTLEHCSDWILRVCEGNRNNVITTIQSPGNQELCVEARINNLNICNNSPTFTEYPAPYICAGQTYCYNNGAFDIDGDSLVYSLETPDNNNGGVSYLGAYSAQNPVAGSTNFDPLTGDLCMDATQAEVSVLAMKITEFRNGVEIGSVVRDIQVIVLNCLTTPPVLSGFNGTPANVTNSTSIDDSLHFCANDFNNINFNILSTLGSSPNKYMSWSGITNAPAAIFNVSNNNSNSPVGSFDWTPQYSDVINSPFSFTVTVEDDACPINNIFSYTYTITLSSNANFSITFSQVNNPTCAGYNDGSVDLQLSGTLGVPTFTWTGPNGFVSTNQNINNIYAGLYDVTITDAAGCILTDNISIIDPTSLTLTSNISNISCVGGNDGAIDITVNPANPNLTFNWTGPNNFTSTSEDIINLYTGDYIVEITDLTGCIFTDTITVPPANPFNASFIIDSISCSGYNDGEIDLVVSSSNSNLTYSWIGPNGFSSTSQDITSLFAGDYQITITDGSGCTFSDTLTMLDPLPITSTTIIPNACDDYFWNNIVYTASGLYTFNTLAANGCDSVATLNLIINNSFIDTINVTTCNDFTWNGTNYTSSGVYMWNGTTVNGCDSTLILDLNINTISTSSVTIQDCNPYIWNGTTYTNSGTYNYTTTNSSGCDSIATLNLQLTTYNLNTQSPICKNDSTNIILDVTDPATNQYTIVINDGIGLYTYVVDSLGLQISNGNNVKLPLSSTSNIILETVTDFNNCKSYPNDTSIVFVNPLPDVQIESFDVCVNESSFLLNQGTPQGGVYYVDKEPTDIFKPYEMQLGKHLIEYYYTDPATNCSNFTQDTITVYNIPLAEFYCDKYITKQDTPITFFNTSSSYVSFIWDFGDNYILEDSLVVQHMYQDTGIYNVELIALNEYDCLDTATLSIEVLPSFTFFVPTVFTPNDDKFNNTFFPVGVGIKSYEMSIYNRWGTKIFNGIDVPWDAKNSQDGTYTYVIKILNLKNREFYYRGFIQVSR